MYSSTAYTFPDTCVSHSDEHSESEENLFQCQYDFVVIFIASEIIGVFLITN